MTLQRITATQMSWSAAAAASPTDSSTSCHSRQLSPIQVTVVFDHFSYCRLVGISFSTWDKHTLSLTQQTSIATNSCIRGTTLLDSWDVSDTNTRYKLKGHLVSIRHQSRTISFCIGSTAVWMNGWMNSLIGIKTNWYAKVYNTYMCPSRQRK